MLHCVGDKALEDEYQDLFDFLITEIPEDLQEVPDFRLPPGLASTWSRTPGLRAKLHSWRKQFDEGYADFSRKSGLKKGVYLKGWKSAANQGISLLEEMEEAGQPASRQLLVTGVIAQLQDRHLGADKKQKALTDLSRLMGDWEHEKEEIGRGSEQELEEDVEKARSMRTLDLIRSIRLGHSDED